ncbi:hypothetical protein FRC02_008158 [Tulasnella sp. 418]|nr:hypothetical protein FRC02_008158 [Tulasnella sp. 418]
MTWETVHHGQTLALIQWNGTFHNPRTGDDDGYPPQELLLRLWDELKAKDAICAWSLLDSTRTDLLSFSEHCLLFATIAYGDPDPSEGQKPREFIGCVYLANSPRLREASIGIVLAPQYMGLGIGPVALKMAISYALETLKFHRIIATVMDVPESERAISVFKRLGFVHEGTHRMASYCPMTGLWRDEIHLALVDIDWICRDSRRSAVKTKGKAADWKKTPWDQMIERHEEEMEQMLRRQDPNLRRTTSNETLRLTPRQSTVEIKTEPSDTEDIFMMDDYDVTSDDEDAQGSNDGVGTVTKKREPSEDANPFEFAEMKHWVANSDQKEVTSEDESNEGSSEWEITDGYSSADLISDHEDL